MLLRRHIIRVICIIGCIGQLYVATFNYMSYDVRYGVQIDFPQSYELPNIDLAIPLTAYLNQTDLFDRFNSSFQSFSDFFNVSTQRLMKNHYVQSAIIADKIKVKDIEELILNPENDIFSLAIKQDNEVHILKKYCKINRYFSNTNIYLRISCRNNSQPIILDVDTISTDNRILMQLAHTINTLFSVRLTDINSNMDSRIRSYTEIPSAVNNLEVTRLAFKRIYYDALPSPYTTDCEYHDRHYELHNCVRDKMLNLPNQTLYSAAILSFNTYPGHLGFQQISGEDFNSIYKYCSRLISKISCNLMTYELRKDYIDGGVQAKFKFLEITPSVDPDIYYTAYPVQVFPEFIIFFMSILSNWFGLSIFEQLIYGTSYCKTCSNRKAKSANTNNKNGWQPIEVATYSIQPTQKIFKPRKLPKH
uniref:Uncharacterized protein n=1 Tax=Tetranychus urticae TaxID=32264 RepID=T1KN83_TETUR